MTDLIILPNVSNIANTTAMPYTSRHAAKGVIYFDDGVSYEKNISKTEIYYTYLGYETTNGSNSSTVQINFMHSGGYSNSSLK